MQKTLGEIIDAMEKNGFPQITRQMVEYSEKSLTIGSDYTGKPEVIGACAMGQAALNLGVDPENLYQTIRWYNSNKNNSEYPPQYPLLTLPIRVFNMNDQQGMSCADIAGKLRKEYADYLNVSLTIPT